MKHLFHILCLLCPAMVLGQVQFTTQVSDNSISVGDRLKVVYSLNTSGSNFKAPNFKGFSVLSGPNQNTAMKWVNGNMSSSMSFSYVLTPKKPGKLTIPGASIKAKDGKTYSSNAVTIKVSKGSSPQAKSGGGNQNNQGGAKSGEELGENLFIRTYVDKLEAYVGEQVTATFKIYTRVNIVNNGVHKLPSFNGFWAQEVELPNNTKLQRTQLNGVPYNVATIKKTVLFPQRSGELEVDPMVLDVVVRVKDNRRSRSIFDQFFGSYKDVKFRVKSNTQKIKVRALPAQGKPAYFTGAVGSFQINASVDKDSIAANDAINLTITYSGNGNIKFIEDPKIDFPPDFEVYDPKVRENINVSGGGVSGSKTYEYLIIPRHSGEFELPPVHFGYFDPMNEAYKTGQTQPFTIQVGRGTGEEASTAYRSVKKEEVKLLGKDIRYIYEGNGKLREKRGRFFNSPLFYGGMAVPLAGLALFLFISKPQNLSRGEYIDVRSKKAAKLANKKLADAKTALQNGDSGKFYEGLLNGLYGYFSDKLKIPIAELNRELVIEKLNGLGVDQETIGNMNKIMDDCELARFGPVEGSNMDTTYTNSVDLIKSIEKNA